MQKSLLIGPKSNHCLALSFSMSLPAFVETWMMWPWCLIGRVWEGHNPWFESLGLWVFWSVASLGLWVFWSFASLGLWVSKIQRLIDQGTQTMNCTRASSWTGYTEGPMTATYYVKIQIQTRIHMTRALNGSPVLDVVATVWFVRIGQSRGSAGQSG